MVENPAAESKK